MTLPPAVILASGKNSRFFPLNTEYHKGLTPLMGRPLLDYSLKSLQSAGCKKVILILNQRDHDSELIRNLVEDYSNSLEISLAVQPQALGMGDALLQVADQLPSEFLVLPPYHPQVGQVASQLAEVVQSTDATAAVCVTETPTPWNYGIVSLEGDRATALVEKPEKGQEPSNLKIQSMYLLNQTFLDILKKEPAAEYSYEAALDSLMQQGTVGFATLEQGLPSLKYPWQLFEKWDEVMTQATSSTHPTAKVAPTAVIDETAGPVVIAAHATVGHASRIVGPAYLGEGSLVGDFSLFRQSSLEAGAKVGVHSDVTRSLFMPGATFHGGGFVGDSIIGPDSKLAAGIVTANKRFDRAEVKVTVKDKSVSIGRNNLGMITGAGVKLGIHTRIMPGVMIGAGSTVYPNVTVSKNVPVETTLKK